MVKLLIVDDEEKIRDAVAEYAEFEGYTAVTAVDGIDAINKVKQEDFDIIIMDIMMPHLDGYTTVKEIKKIKDIPVIGLSAKTEESDKLYGFELGMDDYVSKPFSLRELMARIGAVLKRYQKDDTQNFAYEGLQIDFAGRQVYIDGEKAKLTPKEFDLLKYLVQNKDIAMSREKLLSNVWGYEYLGEDRTVDTHIKMLRSNLKEYRDLIVTMRGMGYKFEIQK